MKTGKLHLANMEIDDDGIREIMETIKQSQPKVSVINLDGNQLSDKGALVLEEMLHDLQFLKELSLQFNDIGPVGATAIFRLKNELDSLDDILLHGNKKLNVREMAEIEQAAQRPKLEP